MTDARLWWRRVTSRLAGLVLATGLALPSAVAQPGDDGDATRATARSLAEQGSAAFEQREFERALELFDQAAELVHAPTLALMQARTLVELGRLTAARERYDAARKLQPQDLENPAFRQAANDAARELQTLLARIPRLRVELVGSQARDARVALDGRTLPPDRATAEQLVDPGQHEVRVTTAAGTTSARTVALAEGAREELVFRLEPPVSAPVTARTKSSVSRDDRELTASTLGWAALGSGAAFAGAGAVIGVLALGQRSDLDAVCKPGCPAAYGDELDAYRRNRTLSYVGFALGAAGIGAGTYLVLRSESNGTALGLSTNGVTLSGRFR